MGPITVDKEVLVERLRQNRLQHQQIFTEAVEGYQKQATEYLTEYIDRIRKGSLLRVQISLPVPENHTEDYDRILDMLEMDTESDVQLNEKDFARYVRDDWGWKEQFLASNSRYSTLAAEQASTFAPSTIS